MRYEVDFSAPLPLGHHAALDRAQQLRSRGHMWTWMAIADAMVVYHGFERSPQWWRKQLHGRCESRARGGSFGRTLA